MSGPADEHWWIALQKTPLKAMRRASLNENAAASHLSFESNTFLLTNIKSFFLKQE